MLITKPLVSVRELAFKVKVPRETVEAQAALAGRYYRPFDLEKKPGSDRWRHIDNPLEPLKRLQKLITRRILRDVDLPLELTGGIAGRSLVDNAKPHVAQPTVVCLDLESFFPHINNDRVYEALRRHLGCSPEVASLLTRLTTYQRRLPQGSAASSYLANLVLVTVMDELRVIAMDRGLRLSCYIDDLTFSGEGAEQAIGEIVGVLASHRLKISRSKLSISHQNEARSVTGVGVNRRPSIPRGKMRAARDFLNSLADSVSVTESELLRAKGIVAQADQINTSQANYLRRRLERVPSASSTNTRSKVKARSRECSLFSRRH